MKRLKLSVAALLCLCISFQSCRLDDSLTSDEKAQVEATVNVWQTLRQSFKLSDDRQHKLVQEYINKMKKDKVYLQTLVKNATPFLHFILGHLKSNDLPGELALVPMLESHYNPFAYSNAGAAGLWQLMPGTATGLGLKQNWWLDERRDVISSTQAATAYLIYLHKFFDGNWLHALAAYNSGEGTVLNAIEKNKKAGKSMHFFALSLPRETKHYVSKLLALVSLIKDPVSHNILLPDFFNQKYFDIVTVHAPIDLIELAQLADMELHELYILNASYNHAGAHHAGPHQILLPSDKLEVFKDNYEKNPPGAENIFTKHKVKKGESLSLIAKKHKIPKDIIQKINQLSGHTIRQGQVLLIPKPQHKVMYTDSILKKLLEYRQKPQAGPTKIVYKVKSGDTLRKIASRFQVRAGAIESWNRLKPNTKLQPGQKLIMWQKKPKGRTHIVKSGETLSHIARRYRTSIKAIKQKNRLRSNTIRKGQRICV